MKHTLAILTIGLAALAVAHSQSIITAPPETEAARTARQVMAAPSQLRTTILNHLDDASRRLWGSPDPQAVLDAIGPRAGELFALNAQFGQLVGALLAEVGDTEGLARLQAIAARTQPHTVNEDGTITLDDPEPASEP